MVNPYGENVAGPVYDKETIVYGTIDLADVDRSRHAVNLSGIYSRWDLININVRQESYEPVTAIEAYDEFAEPSAEEELQALSAQVERLERRITRLSREIRAEEGDEQEKEPQEPLPSLP